MFIVEIRVRTILLPFFWVRFLFLVTVSLLNAVAKSYVVSVFHGHAFYVVYFSHGFITHFLFSFSLSLKFELSLDSWKKIQCWNLVSQTFPILWSSFAISSTTNDLCHVIKILDYFPAA